MTEQEARENLEYWLELSSHSIMYSEYEKLIAEARNVLGEEEYKKIWDRWVSDRVYCSDGCYRKKINL